MIRFCETSSEAEEYGYASFNGLQLRLIPEHSLYGHVLFNASKVLCEVLEKYDLTGKRVLELGAGAALPSLVAASKGALCTAADFPEQVILDNIAFNAAENGLTVTVRGMLFGEDPGAKFDYVLLSDCIQIISEHDNIVRTIELAAKPETRVVITCQVHQPAKWRKQLEFFAKADRAFETIERFEVRCERQFEEDDTIYDKNSRELCTVVVLKRRDVSL